MVKTSRCGRDDPGSNPGRGSFFITIFGHTLLSLVSLKSLKALNCVHPFIRHHESLPSRFGSRRRRRQCTPSRSFGRGRTWLRFFTHPSPRQTRTTIGCETQKLCGTTHATWRWWTSTTRPSTDFTASNGTSPPTCHSRTSPPRSRSPTQRSFSHQHQFQSIETLVPFHSHAGERMDEQRSPSSRSHATNLAHAEFQRTISIG